MADPNNPNGYKEGQWLWDDPDHGGYTKFDDATSAQIEGRLKEAIAAKTKGPIEVQLNKGPWFSKAKNQGIYSAVIMVDCTDPSSPIIHQARQTNTNSGFKRPIRRYPPLDPPLDAQSAAILLSLEGKWEWKDDGGWKEYDLLTMQQIERGYKDELKKVVLSAGSWFGKASNTGVYYIEYNYLSLPCSAQQHNKKSHYGRWVRRIPVRQIEVKEQLTKQQKFFIKKDKHFLWRRHYFPLSITDFNDQKDDNLKCSICLSELEFNNLLQNQYPNKIKPPVAVTAVAAVAAVVDNSNDNDDNKSNNNNNNNNKQHKFSLVSSRKYVSNDTIIGLSQCVYGHYFHAECVLQALNTSNKCPNCQCAYGVIIGNQPEGRLYVTLTRAKCSGTDAINSIKLLFEFPGGIQNKNHPNPGKIYFGDLREAFLPNNVAGREAAMLTRLAFKRKLIFSIGRSLTLNQDNRIIFGSIHLKTSTSGGQQKHGYPDNGYFNRFKAELKQKGITVNQLGKLEKNFIKNGFSKLDK